MIKITAKRLKPGDAFALSTRKNAKVYTIGSNDQCVHTFSEKDTVPKQFMGMLLLVFNNCRQMTINPSTEVYLKD